VREQPRETGRVVAGKTNQTLRRCRLEQEGMWFLCEAGQNVERNRVRFPFSSSRSGLSNQHTRSTNPTRTIFSRLFMLLMVSKL